MYVRNVGIFGLAGEASPLIATLTATNVHAAFNGNNGGYPVTVVGTSFPLAKDEITVTVCDVKANIVSVTNIQVVFTLPSACSSITEPGDTNILISTNSPILKVTTLYKLSDSTASAQTGTVQVDVFADLPRNSQGRSKKQDKRAP